MRFLKSRFFAVISGTLLALAAGNAALADDTEIFFNQNTGSIPANILFILDTSGSMNDLVTSQLEYDGSLTYNADKCGTAFDTNYYYYSAKNIPKCGSTAKIAITQFKCANMAGAILNTGYATDAFTQWGSTNSSKSTGKGTAANPTVTVSTTTYGWQSTLTSANTTGFVECKADAGVDGDGVNKVNVYASKDTFSLQTTTTTPPGSVVVNSDTTTCTGCTTGVWSNLGAKNYFGSASGGTYTIYTANYLNYLNDSSQTSTKSKMSIMHTAAASLMNSMTGVNVGLMRYNFKGSGGMVLAPIAPIDTGTNRADRIALVNSWAPDGITPLSETYFESYLYFSGQKVNYGNNSVSTTCTSWNATNGQCNADTSFSAPSVPSSRAGGVAGAANYDSPADFSCRKNFIVYLTDGLPNENSNSDAAIKALGVTCDATTFPGANGGKCLSALAGYMYNNDMRPDITKVQNVTSYFIGFGADFASGGAPTAAFTYLNNAATAGGGQAFTATNLTELTDAFNTILAQVIKTNTTFSAPAVAVNAFNRTQTLNDLYVSVFSPNVDYHWPGNVKKYKVVNNLVTDAQGLPAVDPTTGFFLDTAQSYWSSVVDGSDVTLGGAASKLPDAAVRKVLTYTGTTYPAPLVAFNDTNVTAVDLNILPGDPAVDDVIDWSKGLDVQDAVPPAGTTDSRHEMGDPIHTQPIAMIYGKKADGTNDTVIYVTTNDGYFHAIDASVTPSGADTATSGQELWSYIPKEMLPHLKDLYADNSTNTKHYGLDGPIAVLKYDINGDGTISGNDRVILFFGTGRNSDTAAYYALEVTDKNNPKLLWKIDASTLTGLGQAWSTPVITRVNISGATQNSQKLVLVMGGGYDAQEDNGTWYAGDNVGNHLYMVDALTGKLLWNAGKTTGSLVNARMTHSIPSPVAVLDLDGDGYADRMYVGDMAAQLWRFDITNGNTAAGLVAGGVIASLGTKDESVHAAADVRRFYSAPDVAAEEKPLIKPFLSVALGSGYRGHPLDTTVQDRFYDVRDYYGFTQEPQSWFNSLAITRDALSSAASSVELVDITATPNPTLAPDILGWQLDLNTHPDWTAGEKSLTPSRTFNDTVIFTTYSPTSVKNADPCAGIGTGTNRVYAVNVFSGSPVIDRNNDGSLTADERSQDLRQGGIAPETAFLFPGGSSGGSGSGSGNGGGSGQVTCLSGVEVLGVCTNFNQRRKTYWREGMAN
jgi:type IV pilus assembly protein PilY1